MSFWMILLGLLCKLFCGRGREAPDRRRDLVLDLAPWQDGEERLDDELEEQSAAQQERPKHSVSTLCLTLPASEDKIIGSLRHGFLRQEKVVPAVWSAVAKACTWYWSGSKEDFLKLGFARLFEPDTTAAESGDEVICLEVRIPTQLAGLASDARFGERLEAIKSLAKVEATVEQISEPISLSEVLNLRFRQHG